MIVDYLEPAQAELDEAFEWYELQHAGLGYELLNEIEAAIRRICLNPEAYPLIARDIRRALVKRFPYGVMFGYDRKVESITVVAIAHLHRRPLYWSSRTEG